jgi:hypothetical protein
MSLTSFHPNKKLPCKIQMNIHSAVQPSILPIPEARSNYDSTSAIELWLSVPRLLGVWLCRLYISISTYYNIAYGRKGNRQNPDFVLRIC